VPTLLADLTTLRLGGPAARVVAATTTDELVQTVLTADNDRQPVLIVGGGSNLVVGDAGWDGLVVSVRTKGISIDTAADSVRVTVAAGESWDELVAMTVADGISGLAAMSGVPGLTGATPVQNVGAYGHEVGQTISGLTVYDRELTEVRHWSPSECGFGFRSSAFKHTDRYVVLDVSFDLVRSPLAGPVRYLELARRLGVDPEAAVPQAELRAAVLELRASKGMLLDAADHDTWSVGSFFVNPFVEPAEVPEGCPSWAVAGSSLVKLSAAWLIEGAGFAKGYGLDRGRGTVAISTKHALALTNRGGATTAELLDLAAEIRAGVLARFGVRLRPEAHLANVDF
jgi:UDP-N-acetylmuramate dehydrogenase